MNTHISPSIIMRTWEFGETDLLVSFFTSDKGRIKGVAKGARKSQKRFANCLDLFCLTDMEYKLRKKGDLYLLHSCKLVHSFPGLRSNFSVLSLASYMIELTEILFPLGVVDKRMFELLKNSFLTLNEDRRIEPTRLYFEAKAMALGGYKINLDKCCICGRPYTSEGTAVFKQSKGGIACLRCEQASKRFPGLEPDTVNELRAIQKAHWGKLESFMPTDKMIRELRDVFNLHIEYRIGKRLKSAKYLENSFPKGIT